MTGEDSITINGITHPMEDLGEEARTQVMNIKVVDAEIARLQRQLAIAQTARNAYVAALVAVVPTPKGVEQ
jgi:hypothetical protein